MTTTTFLALKKKTAGSDKMQSDSKYNTNDLFLNQYFCLAFLNKIN